MNARDSIGRRMAFWGLLLLAAVVSAWWVFHVAYDEDILYRSIPSTATLISEHDAPASRFPALCGNYAVQSILERMGVPEGHLGSLSRHEGIQSLLDRFVSRKAVVAYVPSLGMQGGEAWVAASWAGGQVQLLRYGILGRMVPALQFERLHDGFRIWTVDRARMPGLKYHLSLAIVDGVVLACLSDDPQAVRYLARRAHGRAPITSRHFSSGKGKEVRWQGMPDRLWVAPGLFAGPWGRGEFRLGFDTSERGRLTSLVRQPFAPSKASAASNVTALADAQTGLTSQLNSRPDLYVLGSLGEGATWGLPAPVMKVVTALSPWTEAFPAETPVFIGLYGGVASGRLLGLRVPTLVVGCRTTQADLFVAGIDGVLDSVNAGTGWGLLPRKPAPGTGLPIVIDTSRGGVYDSLDTSQRPAFLARDGWIWLASSALAFEGVLGGAASAASSSWRLAPPMDGAGGTHVYVWSDLDVTGQSIRDALAVASLSLLASNAPDSPALIAKLTRARVLVEALQHLGQCRVELRRVSGEREITVEFLDPHKKP
jgi:hypothetical protein